VEGRTLNSKDNIFTKAGAVKNNNTAVIFSAAVNF
jgi:hypothetical protein